MKVSSLLILVSFSLCSFKIHSQNDLYTQSKQSFHLTEKGASYLASLPLKCLDKEFPYKTGIVFLDSSLVTHPKEYHPAFFGCYDWHSSVHGHWMLVRLMKQFPNLPETERIKLILNNHLSAANIQKEIAIFKDDNASFERIYGWGWFLYLQRELLLWDEPWAKQISDNLQPLATHFSTAWIKFLNKIVYPIRVGEHTNLAYGLSFTWDYAFTSKDTALQRAVKEAAFRFYRNDKNCPAA